MVTDLKEAIFMIGCGVLTSVVSVKAYNRLFHSNLNVNLTVDIPEEEILPQEEK